MSTARGRHRKPKAQPIRTMARESSSSVVAGSVALSGAFVVSNHVQPEAIQYVASPNVSNVESLAPEAHAAKVTATQFLEARTVTAAAKASRNRQISIVQAQITRAKSQLANASLAGADVLATADNYKGVRYSWGGSSPRGFDCSGYTQYVFKQLGVSIPRVAQAQSNFSEHISRSEVKPGDLVFFHSKNGYVYHVGIYAGDGKIWHSPRPGQSVRLENIWTSAVYYGRVPQAAVGANAANTIAEKTAELTALKGDPIKQPKVVVRIVSKSGEVVNYEAPAAAVK